MSDEQNTTHEFTRTPDAEGKRPVQKFTGSGGLAVAIWKTKGENDHDMYSVKIDRSYKDESGEYRSTSYLRDSDVLRVQRLLQQADDWIEQDKANGRASGLKAANAR